jgi:phage tail-like protein
MADAVRNDPFLGYNFRVTLGASAQLGFRKVSGLKIGVDVAEYREGTDAAGNTVRKLPGLATYDNITLERGVTDNEDLVAWMKEVVDLGTESSLTRGFRREVKIEVLSRNQELLRTYTATAAWPVGLELSDLDATSSDVLIQTLELAHEGLSVDVAVGSSTAV